MLRIHVLLVEDDEDDHVMTQAMLRDIAECEYVLTWARTFEEGLMRLANENFDVCLLDYSLGAQTGLELLTAASEAGVEVPFIFLTGQAQRTLDVQATRSGAADYLVKGSIDPDMLERSIRYAIERGRSVSTLRQLNRELELTRNLALQANRAKSAFLSDVGHAYREPLGTILATSDALQALVTDAQGAEYVREIREAGQRLLTVLSDVFYVSDRPAEEPAVVMQRIEVAAFVGEIAAAIRPQVGRNGNTFEVECGEDVGAASTDPALLGRVLLTLLGNVCKFARRGRISLAVARRRDLPGEWAREWVELSIRPGGLWLEPAQLDSLFASFPQAEAGEAPRGEGSESGIVSSRRICQALGGELFVDSEGPRRLVLRVLVPVSPGG